MVQLGIWSSMDKSVFPLHPPSSLYGVLIAVDSLWPYVYLMHTLSFIHEWKWFHYIRFLLFPFSFLFSFRTLYCYPPKKYLKTRHPGKPTIAWKSYFQGSLLTSHGGQVVVQTPDHPDEWVFGEYQAGTLVYQLVLVSKEPTILVWPESKYYPPTSACLVRKNLR
jgi:hypothetical protein